MCLELVKIIVVRKQTNHELLYLNPRISGQPVPPNLTLTIRARESLTLEDF